MVICPQKNSTMCGLSSKSVMVAFCLALFVSMLSGPAEAALQCYDCHGTRSTLDNRPVDAAFRNPSSGGFQGNHRTHLDSSASFNACNICHPGSSYTASHRDGQIKISPRINGSASTTYYPSYNNNTSSFSQASNPTMGTCSNVNCHFEAETPAWGTDPAVTNCGTCHGAPPSGTSSSYNGGAAGSHAKHDQYYHGSDNCNKCHTDNATFAHATSAGNRVLNISFATAPNNGNGSYTGQLNDYLPSQNNLFGDCTNTYCHSKGTSATPSDASPNITATWGGTLNANCYGCHGNDNSAAYRMGTVGSAAHIKHVQSYAYGCVKCHAATVSGNRTISNYANHINRQVNVAFNNSTTAENGTYAGTASPMTKIPGSASGTCANVYCHSNGNGGMPNNNTFTWDSPQGILGCTGCHSGNAASGAITTGKHPAHVNNAAVLGTNIGCAECHAKTVDSDANISNTLNHVNKLKDYSGVKAGQSGTYSTASGVCSAPYCHSDGKGTAKSMTSDNWKAATTLDCKGCHGSDAAPAFTSGTAGEPNYANLGAGVPRANSHEKHTTAGPAICDACHIGTTTSGTAIKAGSSLHVNKAIDVGFNSAKAGTGVGWSAGTKTCDNISCHGGTSAQWGGSVGCIDCHGSSTADTDYFTFAFNYSPTAKIHLTEWKTTGHGRMSSAASGPSGRYPGSNNPAANLPGNPCRYCHDNNVLHNYSGNPFRLKQHSQYGSRFDKECVYCHMQGTVPECLGCHNVDQVNGRSLAPQLENISSSGTRIPLWANNSSVHVPRPDHRPWQNSGGVPSCLSSSYLGTPCHYVDTLDSRQDAKLHNTGAGFWSLAQIADVKNQYMSMGVCLKCHDDDSNNKCTGCHTPPADNLKKYDLGYDPGSGHVKPKKAHASSVHFGFKHYRGSLLTGGVDPNGRATGIWKGGKFCWDCHDPHGDSNIFMIHDKVATQTDGRFGIPKQTARVIFTQKLDGSDYVKQSAPYTGICNVCHGADTHHYQAGGGDSHNSNTACIACHEHRFSDSHAEGSPCGSCHKNKPAPGHSAFGLPVYCLKCHTDSVAASSRGAPTTCREFRSATGTATSATGSPTAQG